MVVSIIGIVLLIIVLTVLIKLDREEKLVKKNAREILDGIYASERISAKCKRANQSLKIKHNLNSF